jgi:hypothetical protein
MKNSLSLIIAAAAVLLLLYFLSSSGEKPPPIPPDTTHAGLTTNDVCMPCHGAGKEAPLKDTHPPKEQCVICHKPGEK